MSVADQGFPRGGGANSKGGYEKPYIWPIFPPKLHEIERIWTPRADAHPWRRPLDPPMNVVKASQWWLFFGALV